MSHYSLTLKNVWNTWDPELNRSANERKVEAAPLRTAGPILDTAEVERESRTEGAAKGRRRQMHGQENEKTPGGPKKRACPLTNAYAE